GNPQNAFIGVASGIPFLSYAATMAPLTVVLLVVSIAWTLWFFRADLERPLDRSALAGAASPEVDRRLLLVVLAISVATFGGFFVSSFVAVPLHHLAFVGGCVALSSTLIGGPATAWRAVRGVDLNVLLLFAGLFVVLAGVVDSGIASVMSDAVLGGVVEPARLSILAVAASNLVSNVPAVILLSAPVAVAGVAQNWLVLAAASTLGGNATILGAAANILVVEAAQKDGIEVDVWRFVRLGFPLTVVTVAIALLWLSFVR
ncbi:MAG TPA: SLC13 family permease, partial [Burkholderiales bacterium]|nr:SLC13 family permease [Burkholderiales bacterium]